MNAVYFSPARRIMIGRVVFALLVAALCVSTSAWYGAAPVVAHALSLLGWALIGVGVIGRIWSGSYICGYKTRRLIVDGPYSITRNPLYLFSFIGGLGVMLITESLLIPALFCVLYLTYHTAVIVREEGKLRRLHGEEFDRYCDRVPRFWPSLANYSEPREYTVNAADFREHLSEVVWFIIIGGLIEFLEALQMSGYLPTYLHIY